MKTTYKDKYGALYKYHTVATGKLCPDGWHVPSYDEFNTDIVWWYWQDPISNNRAFSVRCLKDN